MVFVPGRKLTSYERGFGRGFGIEIAGEAAEKESRDILAQDAIVIKGAAVDAVEHTTNSVKTKIRNFIDQHFRGSEMHGNNHRRVSNAAAQSKFYNDLSTQGQYTGLVYSKWGRGKGPGSFIDFLVLHIQGGTLEARDGGKLKIPNRKAPGSLMGQVGDFGSSRIFIRKGEDGKSFLMRAFKNGAGGQRGGRVVLLATLVDELRFPASLRGIETILAAAGPELENNFLALLGQSGTTGTAA
ncbi:hypothetical protein NUH86_01740 [Sphingobium sp. JS3065]|uniref:hypothetical protein n=1 Tax=Sphingobium sp. JS3065 TaxID=2970925 RepID=UPI002264A320|nr:hypothetical protein [Sphingobium sp. JS3065]UZW55553.1 hypothetical protein NUH86_01740 [Sphingobium sp. JS3065]